MRLRPIAKKTLSEQVATQVGDMISSGQWKCGDRLPSEADLSKSLGVSRSTVREALRSLAFIGLVQMRMGQGTYVAGSTPKFFDRLLTHGVLNTEQDLRDLTDVRMALETESAALCAERATDEELQQLGLVVKQMETTLHAVGEEFLDLDLEFHIAIATYSKSQVLLQLLKTIRSLLKEFIAKSAQMPGDRDLAYAGHSRIFEALKERSPLKARTAMRSHLQDFLRGYRLLMRAAVIGGQTSPTESGTANADGELLHNNQS